MSRHKVILFILTIISFLSAQDDCGKFVLPFTYEVTGDRAQRLLNTFFANDSLYAVNTETGDTAIFHNKKNRWFVCDSLCTGLYDIYDLEERLLIESIFLINYSNKDNLKMEKDK